MVTAVKKVCSADFSQTHTYRERERALIRNIAVNTDHTAMDQSHTSIA